MKKMAAVRIAGLTLSLLPITLSGQTISDVTKGLLTGIGIGLLILSLYFQIKKPKSI